MVETFKFQVLSSKFSTQSSTNYVNKRNKYKLPIYIQNLLHYQSQL